MTILDIAKLKKRYGISFIDCETVALVACMDTPTIPTLAKRAGVTQSNMHKRVHKLIALRFLCKYKCKEISSYTIIALMTKGKNLAKKLNEQ
jgi:DNA-binding MarR family transcriptional regulator